MLNKCLKNYDDPYAFQVIICIDKTPEVEGIKYIVIAMN